MTFLAQDLRYGFRRIVKSPGFACLTILTLALGIGANCAVFTLLDAVLLRALPVPDPRRIVEIATIYRNGAKVPLSYAVLQQLEENQRVFSSIFGWTGNFDRNLDVNGSLTLASVRGVTGDYYHSLDATPLLGRLLMPADAARIPGAPETCKSFRPKERP